MTRRPDRAGAAPPPRAAPVAAPRLSALRDLRAQLHGVRDQLLCRDATRLGRELHRADPARFDTARFGRDLTAAIARAAQRRALAPATIRYPEELPVAQAREQLLQAIRAHQVVVICGETGSGKTTQLPKLCLELGRGLRGLIGHTQPRRLAARSVAHRIASELQVKLGDQVGFETRFDKRTSERTLVKLMTDGILLAELQRDRELLAYDTIILDEAHERSLNIDFLLGWIRQLLPRRPELKLIVTSATLDPQKLSRHFSDAPVLVVEGRTYPVELRYREPDKNAELEDCVADAIDELWRGGRIGDSLQSRPAAGDTLVFLPGEREINELSRTLGGRFPHAQILPLFSRLPAAQQDRVFSPGGPPRIVLTTNVAETSVTVPGIRYVVDVGTARMNRWSTRLGIQQLHIEPVSQAAANQRAGRCGRVGPGVCVRLYAEEDFAARPAFTDPEVLRANLAGVILQMSALGLGDVDCFAWLDEPDSRQISEGYRLLEMLGALDESTAGGRRLTPVGRSLARLPLDPRVARIALGGRDLPCRHEVWALAAALSVQDPHETPLEAKTQAQQKHAEWRHPRSDFLTLLGLWRRWQRWSAESSNRQLRKLCREHFVSFLRMEEWEAIYRQVCDFLDTPPQDSAPASDDDFDGLYAPLHKALLAGLVDHVGVKLPASSEYQGPRGRRLRIFPGSKLAKKSPQWLMCAAIVETSQVFARTCAAIEPEWLIEVAPHLVKRTVQAPEWNAERGEVSCTEHLTLFGLALGTQLKHFGSIDPAGARDIFILEALVRGNLPNKPSFLQHNLRLMDEVREKETRMRRPDLLADEDQLHAWYAARIPPEVCTSAGLKRLLHARQPGGARVELRMGEPDALRPGADANIRNRFPDHLDVAGQRLRLSYAHEPGDEADGVSFHIPLALLYILPAARFDWLVPGLLPERIEALIRSLPMHLRRQCSPVVEYATALANSLDADSGELLPAMCARFQAMTGVQLRPDDFADARLPAHLKPRLLVEDAQGRRLAIAGSLIELQRAQTEPARAALASTAAADELTRRWVRPHLLDWDFGDLPDCLELPDGARAFPALRFNQEPDRERVGLALFESADAARSAHVQGVRALLLTRLANRMRDLVRSARTKLGLAQIGLDLAPEVLARQVARRAADLAWKLGDIRSQADFQQAQQQRAEFGRLAVAMLDEACDWLIAAADLRKRLRALGEQWPQARADVERQLAQLLAPGFVEAIPPPQRARMAVYLKAAAIRLDRLPLKPARDLQQTALMRPLLAQLPAPFHPAHWLLEEWRIALFAQELRAVGGPTPERIRALLAA